MNKELEKLYYNPKYGFTSSTKFYKIARENNINVTKNMRIKSSPPNKKDL